MPPIICGRILKPTILLMRFGVWLPEVRGTRKKVQPLGDWLAISCLLPLLAHCGRSAWQGLKNIFPHRISRIVTISFRIGFMQRMMPLSTRLQSTWNPKQIFIHVL